MKDFMVRAEDRELLYDFIARYVRKVFADTLITKALRETQGYSFLDLIRPSDIAYVVSLVKNSRGMWDQEIAMKDSAVSAEAKVRPLFTGGKGKKKEQGRTLWTKEGIKYFNTGEKNWKRTYVDKKVMGVLYGGWDRYLNGKGKLYKVGDDSSKTFHQVMATWYEDNGDTEEVKSVGSDESIRDDVTDDEDGYASDRGTFLTNAHEFRQQRLEDHKGSGKKEVKSTPEDKSEEPPAETRKEKIREEERKGKSKGKRKKGEEMSDEIESSEEEEETDKRRKKGAKLFETPGKKGTEKKSELSPAKSTRAMMKKR